MLHSNVSIYTLAHALQENRESCLVLCFSCKCTHCGVASYSMQTYFCTCFKLLVWVMRCHSTPRWLWSFLYKHWHLQASRRSTNVIKTKERAKKSKAQAVHLGDFIMLLMARTAMVTHSSQVCGKHWSVLLLLLVVCIHKVAHNEGREWLSARHVYFMFMHQKKGIQYIYINEDCSRVPSLSQVSFKVSSQWMSNLSATQVQVTDSNPLLCLKRRLFKKTTKIKQK